MIKQFFIAILFCSCLLHANALHELHGPVKNCDKYDGGASSGWILNADHTDCECSAPGYNSFNQDQIDALNHVIEDLDYWLAAEKQSEQDLSDAKEALATQFKLLQDARGNATYHMRDNCVDENEFNWFNEQFTEAHNMLQIPEDNPTAADFYNDLTHFEELVEDALEYISKKEEQISDYESELEIRSITDQETIDWFNTEIDKFKDAIQSKKVELNGLLVNLATAKEGLKGELPEGCQAIELSSIVYKHERQLLAKKEEVDNSELRLQDNKHAVAEAKVILIETSNTICVKCGAGEKRGVMGESSCVPCDDGSIAAAEGTAQCTVCPAGQTHNSDKTACVACPAGQTSVNGICEDCPDGKYVNAGTGGLCAYPADGYIPTSAQDDVKDCDSELTGTWSNEGHTECSECKKGWQKKAQPPTDGSSPCIRTCDLGEDTREQPATDEQQYKDACECDATRNHVMNAVTKRCVRPDSPKITDKNIHKLVQRCLKESADGYCPNHPNGLIDGWNVSSVTNMNSLFEGAAEFNQNINAWDVSQVTDLSSMFKDAKAFNNIVMTWKTGSATTMKSMFEGAEAFNQIIQTDLNAPSGPWWDVSKVTDFSSMFKDAKAFNQPLNSWNTGSATTMKSMFEGAKAFDQPISTNGEKWDVSKVTDFSSMFKNAKAFNQQVPSGTGSATTMREMFSGAEAFTNGFQSLVLDTSNVVDMNSMMKDTKALDLAHLPHYVPLTWDTSKVTDMQSLFEGSKIGSLQAIVDLDVSNVQTMENMLKVDGTLAPSGGPRKVFAVKDVNNPERNVLLNPLVTTAGLPDTFWEAMAHDYITAYNGVQMRDNHVGLEPCPAGTAGTGGDCTLCDGTYEPNSLRSQCKPTVCLDEDNQEPVDFKYVNDAHVPGYVNEDGEEAKRKCISCRDLEVDGVVMYKASEDLSKCVPFECGEGQYHIRVGEYDETCGDCPLGFQPADSDGQNGNDHCVPCPPGTEPDTAGVCKPCNGVSSYTNKYIQGDYATLESLHEQMSTYDDDLAGLNTKLNAVRANANNYNDIIIQYQASESTNEALYNERLAIYNENHEFNEIEQQRFLNDAENDYIEVSAVNARQILSNRFKQEEKTLYETVLGVEEELDGDGNVVNPATGLIKNVDDAAAELTTAQNDKDEAKNALQGALEQLAVLEITVQDATAARDAAQTAKDVAQEAKDDAQTERDDAQTLRDADSGIDEAITDQLQALLYEAQADLTEAEATLNAAQTALDNAQTDLDTATDALDNAQTSDHTDYIDIDYLRASYINAIQDVFDKDVDYRRAQQMVASTQSTIDALTVNNNLEDSLVSALGLTGHDIREFDIHFDALFNDAQPPLSGFTVPEEEVLVVPDAEHKLVTEVVLLADNYNDAALDGETVTLSIGDLYTDPENKLGFEGVVLGHVDGERVQFGNTPEEATVVNRESDATLVLRYGEVYFEDEIADLEAMAENYETEKAKFQDGSILGPAIADIIAEIVGGNNGARTELSAAENKLQYYYGAIHVENPDADKIVELKAWLQILGATQSCVDCELGQGANDAKTECVVCAAGEYGVQGDTGSGTCAQCPEGKTQPLTGKISCNYCPGGTHDDGSEKCAINAYNQVSPAGIVTVCNVGTYKADEDICDNCPAGTKGELTADSNGNNALACVACPGGTYQDETGQTECKDFEPGFIGTKDLGYHALCIDDYISNANHDDCVKCGWSFSSDTGPVKLIPNNEHSECIDPANAAAAEEPAEEPAEDEAAEDDAAEEPAVVTVGEYLGLEGSFLATGELSSGCSIEGREQFYQRYNDHGSCVDNGWNQIENEEECKVAAVSLGLQYNRGDVDQTKPPGCFIHSGMGDGVYHNQHDTPNLAAEYDVLCKKENYPSNKHRLYNDCGLCGKITYDVNHVYIYGDEQDGSCTRDTYTHDAMGALIDTTDSSRLGYDNNIGSSDQGNVDSIVELQNNIELVERVRSTELYGDIKNEDCRGESFILAQSRRANLVCHNEVKDLGYEDGVDCGGICENACEVTEEEFCPLHELCGHHQKVDQLGVKGLKTLLENAKQDAKDEKQTLEELKGRYDQYIAYLTDKLEDLTQELQQVSDQDAIDQINNDINSLQDDLGVAEAARAETEDLMNRAENTESDIGDALIGVENALTQANTDIVSLKGYIDSIRTASSEELPALFDDRHVEEAAAIERINSAIQAAENALTSAAADDTAVDCSQYNNANFGALSLGEQSSVITNCNDAEGCTWNTDPSNPQCINE